jgi:AcrR family transcriptional regulator
VTHITTASSTDRPLRADAERNRRRILDAARELFARRGLEATLNDVARQAGVGVGTVYRRFADKGELIDCLFEEDFAEMFDRAQVARDDPDAWHGLVAFVTWTAEQHAADKGLKDLLTATPEGMARIARVRDKLMPMAMELVARAQAAGQLREDLDPSDFALIQVMIGSVIDAAREVDPAVWRRYLDLVLRGMAADPASMTLGTPPLATEQVDRVMSRFKSARRD